MPRRRQKVAEQVLAAAATAATAARLSCLPAQFFVPECFDQGFSLTAPTASSAVEFLKVPDGNKRQDYINFIDEITSKSENPECAFASMRGASCAIRRLGGGNAAHRAFAAGANELLRTVVGGDLCQPIANRRLT